MDFNETVLDNELPSTNMTAFLDELVDTHIVRRMLRNQTYLDEQCKFSSEFFLLLNLLPSVFILVLLSFLERRKKIYTLEKRFSCLRGRFGIVVPLDFMSSLENRWSYAFAFGAITPLIFNLFFGVTNPFPFTPPRYIKVIVFLVAALEVGIVCKPFFACLSTQHQLLGGVLGLLYSLSWLIVQMWDLIWCKGTIKRHEGIMKYSTQFQWLYDAPHLISLVFLIFRFGIKIVENLLIRLKKQSNQKEVKEHQYQYVQRLLGHPAKVSVEKSWFQKHVYEWDPYFKFPNRIIVTAALSFLGMYSVVLLELMTSIWCIENLYDQKYFFFITFMNKSTWITHLNYITYSWYITSACAAVSSVVHISQVMVYYRKHIKSVWAGEKKHLPKKLGTAVSVAGILRYPGYQIAFTMWGYLIAHIAIFSVALVFVYLVLSPIREDGFLVWLRELLNILGNFFTVFTLMRFQRIVIKRFFLQDKHSSQDKEKPLALKNRRAFHNFNYYLFFFNVIVGMGSCLLRLIKSAVVSVMLVSHIERTIMPEGFKKLDTSHSTWLGMMMTDHHHNNPVLVCFCHLMIKHTLQSVQDNKDVKPEPPAKKQAHVRWVLVYTLLRNPELILLRKTRRDTKREDLERSFIWAMSTRRDNKTTAGAFKAAQTLISALHEEQEGESDEKEVVEERITY